MTTDTRNIYFVRHGQTEANVKHIAQGSDSSLTEKGKEQARCLAKRLKKVPFDTLLASPYLRAQQTAEMVRQDASCDYKIITLQELHERKKPLITYWYFE